MIISIFQIISGILFKHNVNVILDLFTINLMIGGPEFDNIGTT